MVSARIIAPKAAPVAPTAQMTTVATTRIHRIPGLWRKIQIITPAMIAVTMTCAQKKGCSRVSFS